MTRTVRRRLYHKLFVEGQERISSLSIIIMGSRDHFTAFADPTDRLLLVLDPTLWHLQRMARGSPQGIRERHLPLSDL